MMLTFQVLALRQREDQALMDKVVVVVVTLFNKGNTWQYRQLITQWPALIYTSIYTT